MPMLGTPPLGSRLNLGHRISTTPPDTTLAELQERLGRLFVRPEPRRQAGLYLEGLLSAAQRKNGWQLAEQIGDARPWRTQRVLSHVLWDEDAARDLSPATSAGPTYSSIWPRRTP